MQLRQGQRSRRVREACRVLAHAERSDRDTLATFGTGFNGYLA